MRGGYISRLPHGYATAGNLLRHIMVNPALINAYVYKKARCGPEIATFRTKTLRFPRVIRLNWLAKIELRGTRRPWSSILLLVILRGGQSSRKIYLSRSIVTYSKMPFK